MKQKILEYIQALIENEKINIHKIILGYSLAILLFFILILASFLNFKANPITTTCLWIGFCIFLFLFIKNNLKKKQQAIKQKLEKLHPIHGEEGASETINKKIKEIISSILGTPNY